MCDAFVNSATPDNTKLQHQRNFDAREGAAVSEWQPIETAPRKIHDRVLLWWTTRGACSGYFDVDSDRNTSGWRGDQDLVIPRDQHRCTHWMPLPDPPASPRQETPTLLTATLDRIQTTLTRGGSITNEDGQWLIDQLRMRTETPEREQEG